MVDQAEIHRKAVGGDVEERREAVKQLRSDFADLPDKKQAWEDLHRLTEDEDGIVRSHATDVIVSAFPHVPNKDEGWDDLIRLTRDEDCWVQFGSAFALGSAFPHVPDKDEAWKDLIRLTENEDYVMRWNVVYVLGSAFLQVPDKDEAWKDLIRLTENEDYGMRRDVARALDSAFSCAPENEGVWEDLHRMTEDEDWLVRLRATDLLGFAFPHIPDKDEACNDLIRLTQDEPCWYVRLRATHVLGSAFPHVPDKDEVWRALVRLTDDEDRGVRVSANHSLGRASIFKATEAESDDDFKSELKNALEFFERSSKVTTYFNPSSFCLPFYRSFYTITFEKTGSEGEVEKYLAEAKSASEGSENKETLLEAVENLANALSEPQKVTDFNAIKSELNACRRYCDRAADLIGDAAEGAPGAAQVLRRGLPIIDDRIKEIIREIQENAEAVCRETRGTGTPYEPLGMEVNKWAGELSDRDYLQNERVASRISDILGMFCDLLLEGRREHPCKIAIEIREKSELGDTLSDIAIVLSYLQPCIESQLKSEENQIDHQKRTTVEIFADIAVHVLVYTVLHYFAEDLMPIIAPILVLSALIILALIIRNAKSR